MSSHHFVTGDIVCFQSRAMMNLPDSFEITALLPQREGTLQYKIRSEHEKFERVVREDDIELVHARPATNNIPANIRNG